MTDTAVPPEEVPANLSIDQQLGYDIDRTWATGAQVFANNNHVMIVFREQTGMQVDGEMKVLARNVGSVVMPRNVAEEVHRALGASLEMLTNASE